MFPFALTCSTKICFILLYLSIFKPVYVPQKQLAIMVDNNVKYSQLSHIANQFWRELCPSYESAWLEVKPPHVVFTDKDNLASITERLSELQSTYNEKASSLRSTIEIKDSFIMFDFLSPLVLVLLKINVPGFMLSIILVGIILWMIPAIREGYLLPILRIIFVHVCLFLLRCISRITPLKTDSLIRKVENDYNEEGMHMGAISMQSQFNKLQNQNCVRNVKIRTLAGKHIPDLVFLDSSSSKIVSTDQFGRIILWDIDENKWIGRLDHLRLVGDERWLAETNLEYFGDNDYDEYMDASCKQVPRAHCVKIDKEGIWVSAGFDDGTILLWNARSTQLVREFLIADDKNRDGFTSKGKDRGFSRTRRNYKHDRVVKLEFLSNNLLLSVHKSGTLREWNINKGEMIQQMKSNHAREITNICVLADESKTEQFIVSSSKDGMVQCWKRSSDKIDKSYWKSMYIIQEHAEITSLSAQQLHNGMGILVTGSMNNAVKVWDLNYGTLLCSLSNEGHTKKKAPEEAEVGGPLLQFSKVVESSDKGNNLEPNSHILKQDMLISDHIDSICQVAVTRIGNPGFENDRCPDCHVVLDSGFFVASCSKDNTVHTWRLDRHTGKDIVGCTRCFKDYHRQQHYANNRTWKTEAPGTPLTGLRYQKRIKKENFASGDESEPDITAERLSLLPKFLGKLDQVKGCGIVFCENMVLAGVRRRHSTEEENRWEAWFASLQYYDPPSLEEEASLIPVITFDLENDDQTKEDDTSIHPSSSLWEQFLLLTFGIKKVRSSPPAIKRSLKQQELKKKKKRDAPVNEEDDEAYDMLPFSVIKQVVSTACGYGFCCDYGNFIKVITFVGPTNDRLNGPADDRLNK